MKATCGDSRSSFRAYSLLVHGRGLENREKSLNTILESQQASERSQWIRSHVVEGMTGRSVSNIKPADVYITSHCSCVLTDFLTRPAATITTHNNTTPLSQQPGCHSGVLEGAQRLILTLNTEVTSEQKTSDRQRS